MSNVRIECHLRMVFNMHIRKTTHAILDGIFRGIIGAIKTSSIGADLIATPRSIIFEFIQVDKTSKSKR